MPERSIAPWLEGIEGEFLPILIESTSQVIRVVAGPGSGKTEGLKRLVQRLVQGDKITPARIFAGTFTRTIASALSQELGADVGEEISVSTLHSLAFRFLRENPAAREGYKLRFLLEFEEEGMLHDVGLAVSETGNHHDRRRALKRVQSDWAERQNLRDARFWGETDRWLRQHGGMLIGEVVPLATKALRAEDIPPASFDYVIVDEYQDLTACEQEMVELIWSRRGSLVVLGDDDQSIYRFRFNHPRGIEEFAQRWGKDAREDTPLPENRRSGRAIVSLANLMMAGAGSTKAPMIPRKAHDGQATFVHWPTIQAEVTGLAAYINARPNTRFLVLVPRRFMGHRLKAAVGEDARTSFHQEVLHHPLLQERFTAAALFAGDDMVSLRAWLALHGTDSKYPQKRNAPAYARLRLTGESDTISILSRISDGSMPVTGTGATHIRNRARRFLELHAAAPRKLADLIRFLFDPDLAVSESDEESRRVIHDDLAMLQDAALALIERPDCQSLAEAMDILRYRIATRAPLLEKDTSPRGRIMTLHSAKGLEADTVIVAGAADQVVPGFPLTDPTENREHREEQRRLLYVSITRARTELVVSWPQLATFEEAKHNAIRIDSSFRDTGAPGSPLVVPLSRSSLLPDTTGLNAVEQLAGSTWLHRLSVCPP